MPSFALTMRHIPKILIALRFCFAPVILVCAWHYGDQAVPFIIMLMYAGLISDILDGVMRASRLCPLKNSMAGQSDGHGILALQRHRRLAPA
jgi:hypothetical protein